MDSSFPVEAQTTISEAFLTKCFTAFDASPPRLYGVPIVLDRDDRTSAEILPPICLSGLLLDRARSALEGAFDRATPSSAAHAHPSTLSVVTLCSPHVNCPEAVDATLRYLGHALKADVVSLDPAVFAQGQRGVLGQDLASALWTFYRKHYSSPLDQAVTDSDIRSAGEALQRLLQCGLPTPVSTSSRRRILYLREFNVFTKAIIPLLAPLHSALSSIPLVTVVVVGVTPTETAMDEQKGLGAKAAVDPSLRRFTQALERSTLAEYLEQELSPSHLKETSRTGRLRSLEDVFTAAFIECNQRSTPGTTRRNDDAETQGIAVLRTRFKVVLWILGAIIASHRSELLSRMSLVTRTLFFVLSSTILWPLTWVIIDALVATIHQCMRRRRRVRAQKAASVFSERPPLPQTTLSSDSPQTRLAFGPILFTSLTAPLPAPVRRIANAQRRQRFLDANMKILSRHLRARNKNLRSITSDEWKESRLIPSAQQFLQTTGNLIWPDGRHIDIANQLPSQSCLKDVWECYYHTYHAQAEIRARVLAEASASHAISDPRIAEVMADTSLSSDEKELLNCIVNPATIRTTYADVLISQDVRNALDAAVSYPIRFPLAYSTGILAEEHLGGVLLYGPPGTGKTLACRALARESGARMLQVQSGTIQRPRVGDSEQIVKAIFSLARRLGPCVVFIDEIDALFGSRHSKMPIWHATMLTDFMQEVEGLLTSELNRKAGVVVIGATNRPQDLDAAVVRRLPIRVLVDLPNLKERQKMLDLYLQSEVVDAQLDIRRLANITPLYSGSDLRNLVRAAAFAAFRETITNATSSVPTAGGPDRIICQRHFDQALREIPPSCAADMKGLEELRSWGGGVRQRSTQD